MSCDLTNAKPRIAARKGHVVDLNIDFINNGELTDPYAIRTVKIYKSQVAPHNLVAEIPIVDPDNGPTAVDYPSPLCMEQVSGSTSS